MGRDSGIVLLTKEYEGKEYAELSEYMHMFARDLQSDFSSNFKGLIAHIPPPPSYTYRVEILWKKTDIGQLNSEELSAADSQAKLQMSETRAKCGFYRTGISRVFKSPGVAEEFTFLNVKSPVSYAKPRNEALLGYEYNISRNLVAALMASHFAHQQFFRGMNIQPENVFYYNKKGPEDEDHLQSIKAACDAKDRLIKELGVTSEFTIAAKTKALVDIRANIHKYFEPDVGQLFYLQNSILPDIDEMVPITPASKELYAELTKRVK